MKALFRPRPMETPETVFFARLTSKKLLAPFWLYSVYYFTHLVYLLVE
jgi:hypothetical protein